MTDPTLPPTDQLSQASGRLGRTPSQQRHHLLEQAPVAPMDVDGLRATVLGLVAFAVGTVVCVLFYDSLQRDGNAWWLGVCLSGLGLGLVGLVYCQLRRKARRAGRWDRD
ncbi:MAG TPA: DUF2530 domain-containing protein [Propionibacteriaceae bacterium]|nr:DUF2530 domain-containing protein [Propionibacteriaceae bacterium]